MSVDIHGLNIAVSGRLIVSDVDLAIADGERLRQIDDFQGDTGAAAIDCCSRRVD